MLLVTERVQQVWQLLKAEINAVASPADAGRILSTVRLYTELRCQTREMMRTEVRQEIRDQVEKDFTLLHPTTDDKETS